MLKKAPNLKSTIRRKVKTNISVRPASEGMIELLTLVFLKILAEEARAKAYEEKKMTIKAHHVKAVSKRVLKKARG